ncbi:MAG TPA: tRNA (adenosine(37)-N6)-threonylcarbamoyltransferase complex dimerization subunit type 1 TsaB [Acidobacteriaceae bacterium]|jgi:tRNA threonylcarbamoyladenosine biosynthesis protein TsaB
MSDPRAAAPILLSIETCSSAGSVALGRLDSAEESVEILEIAEFAGRTHSAHLIPKIGQLLAAQKVKLSDLQAIVVVRGPGSFTGIRVGLSTAKGLAEAAKVPIIAISRLALLASVSGLPHVLAVIPAGREEYYAGEYQEGRMLRESLLSGEETKAAAMQPDAGVLVCEEAANLVESETLQTLFTESPPVYVTAPDAADALNFALGRFRARIFDDVETLDANYLRRSDAEIFGAPDATDKKGLGSPSNQR